MKHRTATLAALALALASGAALAGPVTYGKGVTLKETTRISDIYQNPDQYAGKTVRVEGVVTDVCSNRGCWMVIASDRDGQTLRFKVEDGVIVIPVAAKGKKAVAEGTLVKTEATKEQAAAMEKHECEEAGRPFDPKSVTGPKTILTLKGTGAIIE